MKTIWKYEFPVKDAFTHTMPEGAIVRHVADQNGTSCMWAEVDPTAPLKPRHFEVFGTGHPMTEDMGISRIYCGTFFQGPFVWHLYERLS